MGLENLVGAMQQLPGVSLYIGGSGPLRADLEARIDECGLSDRVHLVGYIADDLLPSWYAAADAFVLPTRCLEGLAW